MNHRRIEGIMQQDGKKYILVLGHNEFERLQLFLWGWFRSARLEVINYGAAQRLVDFLKKIPFINNYIRDSVGQHKIYLGDYNGLWFEVSNETTDLTIDCYNAIIKKDSKIINYYSRFLNTNKFEAYIKKVLSTDVQLLLKQLHIIRLSAFLLENEILEI